MFESEANHVTARAAELPAEILARFAESRAVVAMRSLIPWGEHCTECVWPTCYTTCDLYAPRPDGRCRRFTDGMVRVDCPEALNSYLLKVSFKRWGKLWSAANLGLHSLAEADRAEALDLKTASYIQFVPIQGIRQAVTRKRYSMKKRRANRPSAGEIKPDCLMIECYNPNAAAVSMSLSVRRDSVPLAFQALIVMQPGFNRHRLAVSEIGLVVDLTQPFGIDLTPNDIADGLTLYFGALDFVFENPSSAASKAGHANGASQGKGICKCVVWDLDNTLWDGTLVEDGLDGIALKPGIPAILRALDERGILSSVASKNNHDDAMQALGRFGLEQYFLVPRISWAPKSRAVAEIAKSLNIGLDSLLVVDDSRFEREEIMAGCPEAAVVDALEYRTLLDRPECQMPVTEESRNRRQFYREHQRRIEARQEFQGDYLTFLRDAGLRLTIRPMTEANLERVHELTQRTNQMNFSGNRYTREQLAGMLQAGGSDTYVLDCQDRFGNYGTIGFCLMDPVEVRMKDLMFSCRVQSKRVEHAFVSYLISKYCVLTPRDFQVDYRKTKKNAGPGAVFDDLGFQMAGEVDGLSRLVFPLSKVAPDEGVVTIEDLLVKTDSCISA